MTKTFTVTFSTDNENIVTKICKYLLHQEDILPKVSCKEHIDDSYISIREWLETSNFKNEFGKYTVYHFSRFDIYKNHIIELLKMEDFCKKINGKYYINITKDIDIENLVDNYVKKLKNKILFKGNFL